MSHLDPFVKNYSEEAQLFSKRLIILFLIVLGLLLSLLARLYYLQISQHKVYNTLSDDNRIALQPIAPMRGLIYDRNGLLIADNQPTYALHIIKERSEDLSQLLNQIDQLIGISEDELRRFNKRQNQRRRPFEGIALKTNLSDQQTAILAVNRHILPGVEIKAQVQRYYPWSIHSAHSIGYVGRINEAELARLDPVNYEGTEYIGKMGIEKFYEPLLHGTVGYQKVEVDARGRVMRVLSQQAPTPGINLQLYLDMKLQQVAHQAMANSRGSVVALDPNTGGILALVSTPSYDPNLFVRGISRKNYARLRDSLDIPLFNRALRGTYPPGSTIKPLVALAGLDQQLVSAQDVIKDRGFFMLPGLSHRYRDWKKYGHGDVDLRRALVESCDTYFYLLAEKMGIDVMSDYLQRFGLGQITSFDLADELSGVLPSRHWKRQAMGQVWFPGETIITAIGQGYTTTSPMQLATAMAMLANKGRFVRPRLIQTAQSEDHEAIGALVKNSEPIAPLVLSNPDHWQLIHDALTEVIHTAKGTASSLNAIVNGNPLRYKIAGKTGTAQVVAIAQDSEYDSDALSERHRDHALFVAFAPVENPQIAIAVIVENGEKAASTAGLVARKVMDAHLLNNIDLTSVSQR